MSKLTVLGKKVGIAVMLVSFTIIFSSCATIFGGSKYYAHVYIENRPGAAIFYKGENIGRGEATVKVRRADADKFSLLVKEDNGEEQEFKFTQRSLRGWALVGSALCWTSITGAGIPLPWGVAVDLCTGACYKPDIMEKGVSKIDLKHFKYTLTYTGYQPETTTNVAAERPATSYTKTESLMNLKSLLDQGVLTQDEYDKEKAKILAE